MRIPFNNISDFSLQKSGYPDGELRVSYPFASMGDNRSIVVERDYLADARYYVPQPLDSGMDKESRELLRQDCGELLLVGESAATAGLGFLRITRTFATVPFAHIERCAQNTVRFGWAVDSTASGGGVKAQWTRDDKYYYILGQPVGARLMVYFTSGYNVYDYPRGMTLYAYVAEDGCKIEVSRVTVTGFWGGYRDQQTIVMQPSMVYNMTGGRIARSGAYDGFTQYDYKHLPDGKIYELSQPLTPIIIASGQETSTLSDGTYPSLSDYKQLMLAGEAYQCAEATIARWKGNIYEIATPFVYAR